MVQDVIFDSTSQDLQDGLEAVDFGLKLAAIASSEPRLFPFLIYAVAVIAGAPATRRLDAIAFDLARFA